MADGIEYHAERQNGGDFNVGARLIAEPKWSVRCFFRANVDGAEVEQGLREMIANRRFLQNDPEAFPTMFKLAFDTRA